MALILDVTHADGSRTRHRLNGDTLTIGRALANDLILDDPYVDANHARVTVNDGGAVVEDLGSVNGLVSGTERLGSSAFVRPGDVLRLGRTSIRFRDANEAVSPALVDGQVSSSVATGNRTVLRFSTTTWARWGIAVLTLVTVIITAWLGDASRATSSKVMSTTLGGTALLALWAGLWSIASRVIVHQFRFVGHLAVVSAVVLAVMAMTVISNWVEFLFPGADASWSLWSVVSFLIAAVLLAALLAGHLSFASSLSRRRRWRVGIIGAATIMGIGLLSELTKGDTFSDVPKYPAVLKPIPAGLIPTKSIGQFEASTRKIKEEVDQLAKK